MRALALWDQRRRRPTQIILGAAIAISSGMSAGTATAAETVAATVSGLPFAPRVEHSLRVGTRGASIRFQAPRTGRLAVVHTLWRRSGRGCRVALHAPAIGAGIGPALVSAPVPDEKRGWVALPLDAQLTEGSVYHLVATCERSRPGRLAYVQDRTGRAARCGGWAVERVRHGRLRPRSCRTAPIFALTFSDGAWWGQPYRPLDARRAVRLCGRHEASATLTPTRTLLLTDLHIPGDREVAFTLTAADGSVLAGRSGGTNGSLAEATGAPVSLVAGTTYTLHLRAPGRRPRCPRLPAMVTELPLGPGLGPVDVRSFQTSDDGGRTWRTFNGTLGVELVTTDAPSTCGGECTPQPPSNSPDAPAPGCGDQCTPHEPPGSLCGNGVLDAGEECDGDAATTCPGGCTDTCHCRPTRTYQSIYTSGYLGTYDPATVPVWPQRVDLILGAVDGQGPLIAAAKQAAIQAGKTDSTFLFYLSLTTLDSKCGCAEEDLYNSIAADHPEFFLRDQNGNRVSNFVDQYGASRLFVVDIGNPAFVDAWAAFAEAKMNRYGWDGVFADNILRGNFYAHSGIPVNPRTGVRYTQAQYRQDVLAALQRLHDRLDAEGKILVGNHSNAWEADSFADPTIRAQITAMHGVEIEDCVYNYAGPAYSEANWIAQLNYLAYANANGVRTMCTGSTSGAIGNSSKRPYLLASYLLTKEAFSTVGDLNSLNDWSDVFTTDLGQPRGGFTCLDPASWAAAPTCPQRGMIYAREWDKGRVLVNPTDGTTVTVPLEQPFVLDGQSVTSVQLGPKSGAILLRP